MADNENQTFLEILINFLTKFINDSFQHMGGPINFITITDIIIALFWSIILSIIIANTYRTTHRGVSYSQSFTQTLVLLGLIVAIVMLIIGTDIARAFTLVGALSIVRFRNAVKDTRDVGFIFFTMAIGMACGTRFYLLGIITTVTGCILIYYLTFTEFGQKGLIQDFLEMHFPISKDYGKVLSPVFLRHLKFYSLLGVDSVDENINRLSFIITFKKTKTPRSFSIKKLFKKELKEREEKIEVKTPKSDLLLELQKIKGISNIKMIEGSSSVEI